jgi:ABC-type transporter Mla subunit MlaD
VNELITAIREEVVPTLQELRRSLQEYTRLAQNLGDPNGPLQLSLSHLRNVTADVDSGQGLAGRLVRDPALADQVEALLLKLNGSAAEAEQLVADLRKTSARLPKMADATDDAIQQLAALTAQTRQTLGQAEAVLKDLRGTTSQLPDTLKSVNRSAEDLPGLMLQADETLRQTQRLVEAMQRNWLIRSEVRDDAPGRIPPGQAGVQP